MGGAASGSLRPCGGRDVGRCFKGVVETAPPGSYHAPEGAPAQIGCRSNGPLGHVTDDIAAIVERALVGTLPDPFEQSSANVFSQPTQELVQHSEWPDTMSLVSQQLSTWSSLVERIRRTQSEVSYIASERRSFGRVQYVQGCKGLCDNAHGAVLKRIQTKIVAKLEWLLKQAKASQALLRCTAGAATTWWQVVSWTSSAGLTEFRAAMVLCSSLPHDEARLLCDATAWKPPSIGFFLRMNRLQGGSFLVRHLRSCL